MADNPLDAEEAARKAEKCVQDISFASGGTGTGFATQYCIAAIRRAILLGRVAQAEKMLNLAVMEVSEGTHWTCRTLKAEHDRLRAEAAKETT